MQTVVRRGAASL